MSKQGHNRFDSDKEWDYGTVVSLPVAIGKETTFWVRTGKRVLLCLSNEKKKALDLIFLNVGVRIRIRGKPLPGIRDLIRIESIEIIV